MEYFLVMYNSRVVNYERKMFIRLTTGVSVYLQQVVCLRMVAVSARHTYVRGGLCMPLRV